MSEKVEGDRNKYFCAFPRKSFENFVARFLTTTYIVTRLVSHQRVVVKFPLSICAFDWVDKKKI